MSCKLPHGVIIKERVSIMLSNLNKAIADKKIAKNAIALAVGMSEKTFHNKIKGETEFTLSEARKVQESFFPEYDWRYLFAPSGDSTTERAS